MSKMQESQSTKETVNISGSNITTGTAQLISKPENPFNGKNASGSHEKTLLKLLEVKKNVKNVIIGKDKVIDLLLISLLCSGHVLIDDIPGTGKTTLVSALAASLGCSFCRIQFTPDVVPSDITGFNMFNLKTGEKEFHKGSIMHQIVLADEINRASPKTQSALLEVMQEYQVTVEGVTLAAPNPFMVLATQNPVDMSGTYQLPEAQMDRFLMCLSLGYPSNKSEMQMLRQHTPVRSTQKLASVISAEEVIEMQKQLESIFCSDSILEYITAVVTATRTDPDVRLGISPRGSIALMRAAKGCAMLSNRNYVIPDDVKLMAPYVLVHRLILHSSATVRQKTPVSVLNEILNRIRVPEAR